MRKLKNYYVWSYWTTNAPVQLGQLIRSGQWSTSKKKIFVGLRNYYAYGGYVFLVETEVSRSPQEIVRRYKPSKRGSFVSARTAPGLQAAIGAIEQVACCGSVTATKPSPNRHYCGVTITRVKG